MARARAKSLDVFLSYVFCHPTELNRIPGQAATRAGTANILYYRIRLLPVLALQEAFGLEQLNIRRSVVACRFELMTFV